MIPAVSEVEQYLGRLVEELDEHGKRLPVRNSHVRGREVTTGSGTVPVLSAAGKR